MKSSFAHAYRAGYQMSTRELRLLIDKLRHVAEKSTNAGYRAVTAEAADVLEAMAEAHAREEPRRDE